MGIIEHRTSVRQYEEKKVPDELVEKILRAGMQAPSACNQQPWEFYVVKDPEKIRELSGASPYAHCAAGAPVVIVPAYRVSGLPAPEYAPIDMAICVENMWLKTDEVELGGVWLAIAPERDRMESVRKILAIPESLEPFCLFALGYPAQVHPQQDRYDEKRIHTVG